MLMHWRCISTVQPPTTAVCSVHSSLSMGSTEPASCYRPGTGLFSILDSVHSRMYCAFLCFVLLVKYTVGEYICMCMPLLYGYSFTPTHWNRSVMLSWGCCGGWVLAGWKGGSRDSFQNFSGTGILYRYVYDAIRPPAFYSFQTSWTPLMYSCMVWGDETPIEEAMSDRPSIVRGLLARGADLSVSKLTV